MFDILIQPLRSVTLLVTALVAFILASLLSLAGCKSGFELHLLAAHGLGALGAEYLAILLWLLQVCGITMSLHLRLLVLVEEMLHGLHDRR